MRVVAGEKKGFKLKTLKGLQLRPTLEQVKESIFNIVAPEIESAVVADMFCGSGNLGIEALSRGAKKCYFIDNSRDALKIVKENLQKVAMTEKSEILKLQLPDTLDRFDALGDITLLLADPPYGTHLATKLLSRIAADGIVRSGCLIVLEHSGKSKASFDPKSYTLLRERQFGQSEILILRKI
jgi:16S rRNA (guanine(966)-N(2))-methyltransferase RsmD